ncbi:E2 ubiquitin-conjugating enzyme [Salvia divinorum]|uniref:E2 ubiquitin-conjugating enzyme n=1 Tax=Salvia divinorum TaxID=28513 RepID=A0ABD1FKY9_SALDI
MQASRARLFKEYKEVQREKTADPDIQLVCDDSNIFKWTALIKGPSETPYEGGVFQLAFSVPEQYPLQPPQVRFLTKIFHPNVHFKTGEICLDILKNAWSPAWTLQSPTELRFRQPSPVWRHQRIPVYGQDVHKTCSHDQEGVREKDFIALDFDFPKCLAYKYRMDVFIPCTGRSLSAKHNLYSSSQISNG